METELNKTIEDREPAPASVPPGHVIETYPHPPAYFNDALEDAERLLKYASEVGLDIEDDIRDHVLIARAAVTTGWDEPTAANLLTALAKLAARLKPVTAESLKACEADARTTINHHLRVPSCWPLLSFLFRLPASSLRRFRTPLKRTSRPPMNLP